ncbi:MAG TPA: hypothetical protein VK880_12040 [Anaerolineales bacterium]|nr:hypothetical protein [Anaerolineales bacterium]
MKKRYLYSLLFGIPGLFVAGIISILVFGGLMGILWIFVFGDNPWPASIETIVSIAFVLVALILWTGFLILGYIVGKRLEKDPAMNRAHVLLSGGLTLLFILFIVIQQWSVGNIGPKSDSVLCSDFCTQHGYSGSGMAPETSFHKMCSCFDDSGNEVMTVPLDVIATGIPK